VFVQIASDSTSGNTSATQTHLILDMSEFNDGLSFQKSGIDSFKEKLQIAKQLADEGLITPEEYALKRQQILDRL